MLIVPDQHAYSSRPTVNNSKNNYQAIQHRPYSPSRNVPYSRPGVFKVWPTTIKMLEADTSSRNVLVLASTHRISSYPAEFAYCFGTMHYRWRRRWAVIDTLYICFAYLTCFTLATEPNFVVMCTCRACRNMCGCARVGILLENLERHVL